MKEALDEAGLAPFLVMQPTGYHTPDAHPKYGFSAIPEMPYGEDRRAEAQAINRRTDGRQREGQMAGKADGRTDIQGTDGGWD